MVFAIGGAIDSYLESVPGGSKLAAAAQLEHRAAWYAQIGEPLEESKHLHKAAQLRREASDVIEIM